MMKLSKALTLAMASALLVATGAARASELTVTLQDITQAGSYGGAAAGFYTLQVTDNSNSVTQTILAMCDDFNTHISIGSTWQANLFDKSQIDGNITKEGDTIKFPPPSPKYNQAGYLFAQALAGTQAQQVDINAAIWNLMDGLTGPPLVGGALTYYNDAVANGGGFDYTNVMRVITSHTPEVAQEFLVGIVPVPAAVWLFGSALGLLAGVRRSQRA